MANKAIRKGSLGAFGGKEGNRPFMSMVLEPDRVKPKGQKKDLQKRWARFNRGERDLGYVKRHKLHGGKSGQYSDPRAALAPEGSDRRLRDIAMLRMAQERRWAQQGMDRPAYMDFQEKMRAEGTHKRLRKARKNLRQKGSGKYGKKDRRLLQQMAEKQYRKTGTNVDPARIRAQALQGRQGELLRRARNERFAQAPRRERRSSDMWLKGPAGDYTPAGRTPLISEAGQRAFKRRKKARRKAARRS